MLQFSPFASEVAHVAEAAEVCLQEAGLVAGRRCSSVDVDGENCEESQLVHSC